MDNPSVATIAAPPVPMTLCALAERTNSADGAFAVVRLDNGSDAVVLSAGPAGLDLVIVPDRAIAPSKATIAVHSDMTATLIADPAAQAALLRQAMTVLIADAAAERNTAYELRRRHSATLAEIRDYAVARHLEGEYCRDGLNVFLDQFGMDRYDPRLKVTYTITGTYEVAGADADAAQSDGNGYLRVDYSRLDHFIEDTGEHTVSIDEVQELDS